MATASAQDTTCPPGYDYRAITDALVELHRDRAFQRGEQAAAYCRTLDEQIVQGGRKGDVCWYSRKAVNSSSDRYSASMPSRLKRPPRAAAPAPLVGRLAHCGACARNKVVPGGRSHRIIRRIRH